MWWRRSVLAVLLFLLAQVPGGAALDIAINTGGPLPPPDPAAVTYTPAQLANPGVNVDTTRLALVTGIAASVTVANPIGTPQSGQLWRLSLCSTSAQPIAWGNEFRGGYGMPLPTITTGASACDLFGFQRDATASRWDIISAVITTGSGVLGPGAVTYTPAQLASPGVNVDTTRVALVTGIAAPVTVANPIGTPQSGQLWRLSLCSTSSQPLTWGNEFRAGYGLALPGTTTGAAACDLLGFQRDAAASRWDIVSTPVVATTGSGTVAYTPAGNHVQVNVDTTRLALVTGIAAPLTLDNPTGTPQPGQLWRLSICSTAPQTLSWDGEFRGGYGLPLPSATTGPGACDLFGFQRDATALRWDVISTSQANLNGPMKFCPLSVGEDNGPVLVNAKLAQIRMCSPIGASGTIVEIGLSANAGTPQVLPMRKSGTAAAVNLLTTALQTGAGGVYACARKTAGASQNGVTPCSAGLQNELYSGEVSFGWVSGTAGGTANTVTMVIYYLPN